MPQFSVTVADTASVATLSHIFNGLKTPSATFYSPCEHPATKNSIITF
ncbi:MAG: hypothetical protein ACRDJU_02635 [Actinomycetota bacterium]